MRLTSIDLLSGANIDVTQAQIAYAKAQATLTEGVKENAKQNRHSKDSLDANTAAGQTNLTNITALAQAAGSYAQAVAGRANSEEAGRLVLEKARAAFVKQALQLGFTRAEVVKLTNAYFGVPARVLTDVEVKIAQALKDAARIQRAISQVKGKAVTVQVNQSGSLQTITRDLQRIAGYGTIAVNIRVNGKVLGLSKGGEVTGGIPGQDSVPALLTPGEYVETVAERRANKLRLGATTPATAGGDGGISVAAGAFPIYVQGSLDRAAVPLIRAEVDAAFRRLGTQVATGRRG